jgi:hypothetical protein
MKYQFCIIVAYFFISGCQNKDDHFNINNIDSIRISIINENIEQNKSIITNKDSIKYIIGELNNCEMEPIQFLANLKMKVIYLNKDEKDLFFNGSSMKFEGKTYKLKRNIKDIIGF